MTVSEKALPLCHEARWISGIFIVVHGLLSFWMSLKPTLSRAISDFKNENGYFIFIKKIRL